MTKRLILSLLLFFSTASFAQVDYKVQNLVRTYPTAFFVKGDVGYSLPIYGKGEKVLFGYVRASASYQTAAVVNTGKIQLDFNPISILNFYYGKSYTDRNYENLSNFDCTTLACTAKIKRDHYGMRLALKYKSILYMGLLNFNNSELDEKVKRDFADELSSLVNTGTKSVLVQHQHLIGHQLDDKWMVGYLGQFNKMRNNEQTSTMNLGIVKYTFNDKWEMIGGLGAFRTRVQKTNATALTLLTWKPEKGLPLF